MDSVGLRTRAGDRGQGAARNHPGSRATGRRKKAGGKVEGGTRGKEAGAAAGRDSIQCGPAFDAVAAFPTAHGGIRQVRRVPRLAVPDFAVYRTVSGAAGGSADARTGGDAAAALGDPKLSGS